MKNVNMTREQAINTIINLLHDGCSIPTASIGNGGAGFFWIYSNVSLQNLVAELKDTDNYNFRVVPESEIAEDFEHSVNLGDSCNKSKRADLTVCPSSVFYVNCVALAGLF